MATAHVNADASRLREICQRYGIATLSIFGSVARGEERPDSDLDLLYTLLPGHRLGWEIDQLADELSKLFGRPVDLVSRKALHEQLRSHVLAEAQDFYAA